MKISVVGTGYVGLVAAVCLAETGHDLIGVDIDESVVQRLNAGEPTIYEPGIKDLLVDNLSKGRLRFTTDIIDGIRNSSVIFVAVPTPPGEDGSADISYVLKVAEVIAKNIDEYKIVVNKSTVPVGTAEQVKKLISSLTAVEFDVVSNPEFLKEGAAIQDFLHPDRIVVGAESLKAFQIMDKIYQPYVRTGAPILHMDVPSAEMTKYVSNAMLATKISFINEMARVCDAVGANINVIRKAVGYDTRIGTSFLFPGVGYGGSCFPKDVRAIVQIGTKTGTGMHLMQAVDKVNDEQKDYICGKIFSVFGKDLTGLRFAVWGLSFKPRTDDMREAPSLHIIGRLLAGGAEVVGHDPQAMKVARTHHFKEDIRYAKSPLEALDQADALVLVTEWNEYRGIDLQAIKACMRGSRVFDGRNIFDREDMERLGMEYYGIGC
ncbi:MAG: UDP-glucose/GDP-mannose dehydrogenase family protein [Planctomycetes bacterium]|nr:UDP-glucose/GDP-mannose dehydrogenase family protein [Planctomycetota bacterium]